MSSSSAASAATPAEIAQETRKHLEKEVHSTQMAIYNFTKRQVIPKALKHQGFDDLETVLQELTRLNGKARKDLQQHIAATTQAEAVNRIEGHTGLLPEMQKKQLDMDEKLDKLVAFAGGKLDIPEDAELAAALRSQRLQQRQQTNLCQALAVEAKKPATVRRPPAQVQQELVAERTQTEAEKQKRQQEIKDTKKNTC